MNTKRSEKHMTKKEKKREYARQRYLQKKEEILEKRKQHYQENKEKTLEKQKNYYKTPMGRAQWLVQGYKREDKKYGRGECTLTAKWVVDNIFTSKCHYCGESNWHKLGCDRIDNSKPHTMDNVVPCCYECNCKRSSKSYEEFLAECNKINKA